MTTYDLSVSTPTASALKVGDIIDCPYTGTSKILTLPKGRFRIEVWGAQGGSYSTFYGGLGGFSQGILTMSRSFRAYLYAGGQPTSTSTTTSAIAGGFNGGGQARVHSYGGTTTYCQAGGGASDVRIDSDSLYARVIVAGGGGGSASADASLLKYGGGLSGASPAVNYGGTQTRAGPNGSFGKGGNAYISGYNYKYAAGGGGGGWYGGGAIAQHSDSTRYETYNGGGSGYVFNKDTAKDYPSGAVVDAECWTPGTTLGGNQTFTSPSGASETGHTGHGHVRITVLSKESINVILWKFEGKTVQKDVAADGAVLYPPDVSPSGFMTVWRDDRGERVFAPFAASEDMTLTGELRELPHLMGKIWDGDPDEYFTFMDMRRIQYNASVLTEVVGLSPIKFADVDRASQFDYSEASLLESLTRSIAAEAGVSVTVDTQWGVNRRLSFVDFERWESNLWKIYKARGGLGDRIPAGKVLVTYSATLFANSWKGTGPYHIDLEMPGIREGSESLFYVHHSASIEARMAEYNGLLRAELMGDRYVRVHALGVKPTADIPVRMSLGGLSMQTTVNVESSDWSGSGPYTATVTLDGAPVNATMGVWGGMSDEEAEAMTNGIISVSAVNGNRVTLRCLGVKPDIAIRPMIMWEATDNE